MDDKYNLTKQQEKIFICVLKRGGVCSSTDLFADLATQSNTTLEYYEAIITVLVRMIERGLLRRSLGQTDTYEEETCIGKNEYLFSIPDNLFLEAVLKYL